jgi:hypothetical protein
MDRTVADGETGDRAIIVVENSLEELKARVGQSTPLRSDGSVLPCALHLVPRT